MKTPKNTYAELATAEAAVVEYETLNSIINRADHIIRVVGNAKTLARASAGIEAALRTGVGYDVYETECIRVAANALKDRAAGMLDNAASIARP